MPLFAGREERCKVDTFIALLKHAQIPNYTGEAIAQYSRECSFGSTPRETITFLVEKAAAAGLPVNFTAAKRSDVGIAVVSDPALLTGEPGGGTERVIRSTGRQEPGGGDIIELPGTDIITDGEDIFIFAPVTATTLVTLTASLRTEITVLRTCPGTGLTGGDISLERGPRDPGQTSVFIALPSRTEVDFDGLRRLEFNDFFPTPSIQRTPVALPTIDLLPRIEELNLRPRLDRQRFGCPS